MVLDVGTVWTRLLSVAAGASAAAGAPGPGTRLRGRRLPPETPWLGLIDFAPLRRAEREVLEPFVAGRLEPLLLVRHLLLARPLGDEIFIDLTPQAVEVMPEGFCDAPRPILILAPAGRTTPERRRAYLDALSRLRIPLAGAGADLWAIREFDAGLLVALAQLADPAQRAEFREALDPSQTHLFDLQLPLAEAAVLDDFVGARDEEGPLAVDLDTVAALHPQAHPLAVYGAVERANNRRRPDRERTWFSARTVVSRVSGRAFPEGAPPAPDAFASAVPDLLPGELQRIYEASQLLEVE